jgi:hypothetical protein
MAGRQGVAPTLYVPQEEGAAAQAGEASDHHPPGYLPGQAMGGRGSQMQVRQAAQGGWWLLPSQPAAPECPRVPPWQPQRPSPSPSLSTGSTTLLIPTRRSQG